MKSRSNSFFFFRVWRFVMFNTNFVLKAQDIFDNLSADQRKKIFDKSCKETVQIICGAYAKSMNESLSNQAVLQCPVCSTREKLLTMFGKNTLSEEFLHSVVEDMDPMLLGMIRMVVTQTVYAHIITEINPVEEYSIEYADSLALALSNIWVINYTDQLLTDVVKVISTQTMIMDTTSVN